MDCFENLRFSRNDREKEKLAMTNKSENQAYYVLKSSQKTSLAEAREVLGRLLILEQLQYRLRGL